MVALKNEKNKSDLRGKLRATLSENLSDFKWNFKRESLESPLFRTFALRKLSDFKRDLSEYFLIVLLLV